MVSTLHQATIERQESKRGGSVIKPSCILKYNKYMKDVDRADQYLSYYSILRKTMKWSKKLVLWLLKGGFTHTMPFQCCSPAVPLPCRYSTALDCVFPIWFTLCGRVWFPLLWLRQILKQNPSLPPPDIPHIILQKMQLRLRSLLTSPKSLPAHLSIRPTTTSYWSYILYLSNTWEKMGIKWSNASAVIDFNKAYDSVRREALYNILIEFGIHKKLVRLIKMCLKHIPGSR
jgi:hypothetical protein